MPVLEYCSAMWCSAVDTHLKLLCRVVNGPRYLSGGVFYYNIVRRISVAVFYMVCKV